MSQNPIALAVPLFFALVGVELLVARRLRRNVYRLNDSFADIGCGIAQQALSTLFGASLLGVYTYVHDQWHVIDLPSNAATFALALVGIDFAYYWWHRASHRVNVLWAAHGVHHQSEDMNLAVALRQAPITNFTILPFYLPLTLFFPMPVLALAAALNTLYQFWIHSELIPKLGPIEWIMNTPSHHRAHHGINPRYIDKNYAGIFIVWDRLFGTFEEESEAVVYGTVTPLRSFDPLWAQVQPWIQIARVARRAPRILDKLVIWLAPPDWTPHGLPPHPPVPPVTPETRAKWDTPTTTLVSAYVLVLLAGAIVATFLLLLFEHSLDARELGFAVAGVLVTLFAGAALIERRPWAWPFELGRVVLAGTIGAAVLSRMI